MQERRDDLIWTTGVDVEKEIERIAGMETWCDLWRDAGMGGSLTFRGVPHRKRNQAHDLAYTPSVFQLPPARVDTAFPRHPNLALVATRPAMSVFLRNAPMKCLTSNE